MEIYQYYGEDILIAQQGQIEMVSGELETQQRLYRRLLSEPGNYLWHLDYGAGLAQFIGQPLSTAVTKQINGIIRRQMFLEATVARTPEPVITLTANGNNLNCNIQYVSVPSGRVYTLSFIVGN